MERDDDVSAVLPTEELQDGDWRRLIEAIHRGMCILVLGPDAVFQDSDGEGPTLTAGLARQLSKELNDNHLVADPDDLVHVAQAYLRESNKDRLDLELAAEEFYKEYWERTSQVHLDLASMPFNLCLSTTHDRYLHNAFENRGIVPVIGHYSFQNSRPDLQVSETADKPIIYSLLGSCDDLPSLVLSENDLLEFLVKVIQGAPPLSDYIRQRLANPDASFLFVGFGLNQWYLRILLHTLKACHHSPKSIAIESDAFEGAADAGKTLVYYGSEYSLNFYCRSIQSFTAELAQRYLQAKGSAPVSVSPLPEGAPTAFLCHCSEDSAAVEKLETDLKQRGIDTWRDRQNLRGGDRWNQVIPKVLDSNEVDYVVVLQSQAMLERQNSRSYFHKEIKIGLEIGSEFGRGVRFVIPCFLEPCDLLPVFQEEKINSIELAGKEGITPLVNTIKEDWVKRSDRNRDQVSD